MIVLLSTSDTDLALAHGHGQQSAAVRGFLGFLRFYRERHRWLAEGESGAQGTHPARSD